MQIKMSVIKEIVILALICPMSVPTWIISIYKLCLNPAKEHNCHSKLDLRIEIIEIKLIQELKVELM